MLEKIKAMLARLSPERQARIKAGADRLEAEIDVTPRMIQAGAECLVESGYLGPEQEVDGSVLLLVDDVLRAALDITPKSEADKLAALIVVACAKAEM